ncbi:hypothetical protein FOZ60_014845 [Perkinsus olseni]|uniref:Uncharacterized protein n=1 Tax=Perkinsus olseni TaxID=32597 RepID=A0A7J6N9N6_PEROL|nr:hypothetical protein FOZ60_014845 [Perkinsus olseni]
MAPGKRSLEGRRKNRARYRAKRARAAKVDRPSPPMPVASSTSSPRYHDWDGDISFSPRYEKLSLALAKAVRAKAEAWVRRPEVRNFLLRYEQASRLEQTEMANKWVALGIECESEQLAATLARLLESTGLGSSETLLQSASPISPIRGRLLESRVTWPGEGPEDCGIAAVAMSGMPLGLSVPFPEDLRTWPAFHEQSLRPGEPEVIRWKGLPDSDLLPLVRKPMTASWLTYSMSRYSANVVWKDPAHSKIRIIKNYRTSGVNHASRMLTAALYPRPSPDTSVTARSWTHLSGTCYIVLTAARSIIIICYAASDVVLLGLAGRNSIEWDCGSCTGSSVFDAQEVSTSFSFARVYAAETAATPEDRARANSRLLEYSLKPRTMASYQTPLRFYEMGFGTISPSNPVTPERLVSFIRGLTGGSLGAGRSLLAQYGSILRRCERWVWFELARASHQKGEALISRALASADRILLDKDKPKKQAAPLCQECLQSLADMQLTPGGLRDQLRSAVLVASIFMLRFDQLPGLIRADISWESSSEGLLVSVIFHDTKTASREERQTLCFVEGRGA